MGDVASVVNDSQSAKINRELRKINEILKEKIILTKQLVSVICPNLIKNNFHKSKVSVE